MDTRWNVVKRSSPDTFDFLPNTVEWIIKAMHEMWHLWHLLVDDLWSAESQFEK